MSLYASFKKDFPYPMKSCSLSKKEIEEANASVKAVRVKVPAKQVTTMTTHQKKEHRSGNTRQLNTFQVQWRARNNRQEAKNEYLIAMKEACNCEEITHSSSR